MNQPARFMFNDLAPSRPRNLAARRRAKARRPLIEGLEDRLVLSTIQWNTTAAPKGGAWDTPGNWVGGVVPGASDTAVINLTSTGTVTTGPNGTALNLQTNSATTVSVNNGKLSLGAATSTVNGPLTVSSTGTLALTS